MIWGAFILCCAMAALLAGLESALLAVSRVRVRHAADDGDKRAEKLAVLLDHRNELLQTAIVANHAFSIAAFALFSFALKPWAGKWCIGAATAIVLPLFLIGLEMMPKSFSRRYPFRLLKRLNSALRTLHFFALPWRWLNKLARPFTESNEDSGAAPRGLNPLVESISSLHLLPETATGLLRCFSKFNSLTAASLMKPLKEIAALPADLPLPSAMSIVQRERQQHQAVINEKGEFIGCFDAASIPPGAPASRKVSQFVHPLIRVKTTDGALSCLQSMRRAGMPLALVLDENAEVAGVLRSSDLIASLLDLRAESGAGQSALN